MLKTVDLASYNNDWYKAEIKASRFKQFTWYLVNVMFFKSPLNPLSGLKVFLLRLFGGQIGKGVVIKPSVSIKYPWKLKIGDHTWVGEGAWIDNLGKVVIGKNVCISQGAMLLTGNHDYSKRGFDLMVRDIILEDGVWLGAKSMVCPGIICRSHAVLAACSVAVAELKPYTVYQGNPASEKALRQIN